MVGQIWIWISFFGQQFQFNSLSVRIDSAWGQQTVNLSKKCVEKITMRCCFTRNCCWTQTTARRAQTGHALSINELIENHSIVTQILAKNFKNIFGHCSHKSFLSSLRSRLLSFWQILSKFNKNSLRSQLKPSFTWLMLSSKFWIAN